MFQLWFFLNQYLNINDLILIDDNGNINCINCKECIRCCKCINCHNKCYIEYYSKEHDKMTKRVIRPYNLMILDNEWGVAAYCENKQEIRHFYLDRISKLEVLDEKY